MHTICIHAMWIRVAPNTALSLENAVLWLLWTMSEVIPNDFVTAKPWLVGQQTVRNDLVTAWSRGLPGLAKKWLGQSWSKTVTWQSKVFVKHLKMRWFNDIQHQCTLHCHLFFDHFDPFYLFTVVESMDQRWTSSYGTSWDAAGWPSN